MNYELPHVVIKPYIAFLSYVLVICYYISIQIHIKSVVKLLKTRHSFVSNGLANGVDPVTIMKIARHGNFETAL